MSHERVGVVGIQERSTGKVIQKARTIKKKHKRRRSRRTRTIVDKSSDITFTNTKTGITTRTITDKSGKTISRKIISVKKPEKTKAPAVISEPKKRFETPFQKIQTKLTPLKDRTKESGFKRGGKAFVSAALGVVDVPAHIIKAYSLGKGIGGSPNERAQLQSSINNFDINKIGQAIGQQIQSSDPADKSSIALSLALAVAPIPLGKGISLNKLKFNTKKEINTLESKISKLENKKGRTRIETKELNLLRQEKKINELDLIILDKTIKDSTTKPKTQQGQVNKVNIVHKDVVKLKVNKSKKQKLKKQRRTITDETKGKGLEKLFRIEEKKFNIKIKKGLPKEKSKLISLLISAERISGEVFSKLKKRIEKETGLKVKVFKKQVLDKSGNAVTELVFGKNKKVTSRFKVKTTVKLLEPKKPKGKKKKQSKRVILVKVSGKRTGLFRLDKKARLQFKGVKHRFATIKNDIKGIRQDFRDVNQAFRTYFVKKKGKKQDVNQAKAKAQHEKQKLKTKIKQKQVQIQKEILKLRSIRGLGLLGAQTLKEAQALKQDLTLINSQINKLKFDNFKGNGKGKGTGKPPKPPVKPPKKPKAPVKPPIKPPRKLRKPPVTPRKPPIFIPIPLLSLDSKLPKGSLLKFNAIYKAKGRTVRLKLGLPINKALKRAAQLIDRTTSRSMELKIVGITKQKDIKKPSIIQKFRLKKSKNKKVLKLVEKTKHIIDTKGEKRGLTIARLLKSKKRVKKSTKTKKKSSKKRSKTRKKSKR